MTRYLGALWLLALPAGAAAQHAGHESLEQHVFTPEAVMRAADHIDLTSDQQAAITEIIRDFQRKELELEWEMQDENQRLVELMRTARVDETAALAQAATVMAVETRVKQAHLSMLVQIKNLLNEEQQEELRAMIQHERQRHELEMRRREDVEQAARIRQIRQIRQTGQIRSGR
jgi:Spy/CpxP family protein refolding chaperone